MCFLNLGFCLHFLNHVVWFIVGQDGASIYLIFKKNKFNFKKNQNNININLLIKKCS